MTHSAPISLWDTTAAERDIQTRTEPDGHVDLAIIGGGFTGLSCALHAAEKGLSAHVLEAQRIGFGGSGRNVGLVNASAWLPPDRIRAQLGASYGTKFVELFNGAPRQVFDLVEKHQIQCEVTRSGTVHGAHAPSGMRDLQARHAQWKALGEPVELLNRDEVRDLTGTSRFYGGLLDHRAGTINPMGYCRGLARAALAAGARISTGARVTKIARDGKRWVVSSDAGTLTADSVVLATNAYTDGLWPRLSGVFDTISYLQVATAPLGDAGAHILPGRQGLWDTGPIMFNCRRDAAGRLLIGTMGRTFGSKDSGLTQRWARKAIARVFPEIGQVDIEEMWHGSIAMTRSHLPRILRLDENVWTPIGYCGRGITTGTIFGRLMAELVSGSDPDALPLPVGELDSNSTGTMRTRLMDMAFTANQVFRSLV